MIGGSLTDMHQTKNTCLAPITREPDACTLVNKEDFSNFDSGKCLEILELYESIWCTSSENKLTISDIMKMINTNMTFKDILDTPDPQTTIQLKQDSTMKEVNMLRAQMVKNQLIVEGDVSDNYMKRLNKVLEQIFYATNAMKSLFRIQRCAHVSYDPAINDDWGVIRFTTYDHNTLKPMQQLINDILYIFWEKGFKRFKGACYSPIKTSTGYNTYAYKLEGDIENILYELGSDQFANNSLWMHTTGNPNNVKGAIKYLQKCKDIRFEDLKKDRGVWAFDNGVYIARKVLDDGSIIKDVFYPYKDKTIPSGIIASKYFEMVFDENIMNMKWNDIPTPVFDSVFTAQQLDKDIIDCVLQCFIGRCLYNVGELDDWQVSMFILGQAGTGKSTLLTKVIKEFYDNSDVAVMSNNIERKFGLMSLYENFIIIAPELKADCTLDQAEFQQMVSGEDVSIARKNESALSIKWKPPILMAGNQMPKWNDNSGSVSRRVAILRFLHTIVEGDTKLGEKLSREIGNIIVKSNRAYLEAIEIFGTDDIWRRIHPYFKDNRKKIAIQTNSLMHFISNRCKIDAQSWCRCEDLLPLLNEHCKQYNFPKESWTPEFYTAPLYTFKLKIVNNHIDEFGTVHNGQSIIGLQLL